MKPEKHETPVFAELEDRQLVRQSSFVDGNWLTSTNTDLLDVTNPADGDTLLTLDTIDTEGTHSAIGSAQAAFGDWSMAHPFERARRLQSWHDQILAHREDLARLITLEQGKPIRESRGEINYAASFLNYYAAQACRADIESVTPPFPDATLSVSREPVGVAGLVTPWNFPSAMLTRKAGAALAAGCTVVAHPSSRTPLSALALAHLAERAGLPAGVFNVLIGSAREIVGAMCADPRIRAFSFTGSTEVGRRLLAQCAPTVKTTIMELGGHAPLLVFADADLGQAVERSLAAKFATSGQDCLAANRLYIQRPVYESFVHSFTERAAALVVDNGLNEHADVGPLMHEGALKKCEVQVADAVARGARLLCGGKRVEGAGSFFAPTVLADVPRDALIMDEETFGPVAALASFDTEAEAVSRANDTEYGLIAYLFTSDYARISRVTRRLEYGMVAVNRAKVTGAAIPFGGVKQSGLGREGSRHGMEAFTEIKYTCIDTR